MSKTCEMCNSTANVLCLDCGKYLCDGCSAKTHEKEENKLHKIEAIPVNTKRSLGNSCEGDNDNNGITKYLKHFNIVIVTLL